MSEPAVSQPQPLFSIILLHCWVCLFHEPLVSPLHHTFIMIWRVLLFSQSGEVVNSYPFSHCWCVLSYKTYLWRRGDEESNVSILYMNVHKLSGTHLQHNMQLGIFLYLHSFINAFFSVHDSGWENKTVGHIVCPMLVQVYLHCAHWSTNVKK